MKALSPTSITANAEDIAESLTRLKELRRVTSEVRHRNDRAHTDR